MSAALLKDEDLSPSPLFFFSSHSFFRSGSCSHCSSMWDRGSLFLLLRKSTAGLILLELRPFPGPAGQGPPSTTPGIPHWVRRKRQPTFPTALGHFGHLASLAQGLIFGSSFRALNRLPGSLS